MRALALALLMLSTLSAPALTTEAQAPSETIAGREIITGSAVALDGNTLLVFDAAAAERYPKAAIRPGRVKVRMFGISAPKMNTVNGWRARARLDILVDPGKVVVRCEVLDTDHYKRPMAQCFIGSDFTDDLGAGMIHAGWAVPYRVFTYGPAAPEGLARMYDRAERTARDNLRGGWRGGK